jgi:hypothetical protein
MGMFLSGDAKEFVEVLDKPVPMAVGIVSNGFGLGILLRNGELASGNGACDEPDKRRS